MNILRNPNNFLKELRLAKKNNIYFKKSTGYGLLQTLHSFLLFCVILSVSIFADIFLLPYKTIDTELKDIYFIMNGSKINTSNIAYKNFGKHKNEILCRVETNEKIFTVSPDYYACFVSLHEKIKIKTTYVMSFVIGSTTKSCNFIEPYINIKSWFMLIPATLLVFAILGLIYKHTDRLITFAALNIILIAIFFFTLILY